MKTVLLSIAILLALGLVAYIVMAVMSQKMPSNLGLENKALRPCPDFPNCVCSEQHTQQDQLHAIAPIPASKETWLKLQQIILTQGGNIQTQQESYIHATFTTPVFRYVDDVELRYDADASLIHIRSASRIGRSDFGVNRKRVAAIKQAL